MAREASVECLLASLDHSLARFCTADATTRSTGHRSGKIEVALEREEGQGWGIVGGIFKDGHFSIEEIKVAGLLAKWNAAHPGEEVAPGDHIISLNGIEPGDERFTGIMRTASSLNILIERKNDLRARFRRVRNRDCMLIEDSPLASAMGLQGSCDCTVEGERWWKLLQCEAESDPACGAAVGSMLGLAIGDAVGHPLEFISVQAKLPAEGMLLERDWPCLWGELNKGALSYRSPLNTFQMKPGQWTDDTSMALCLADSLLVNYGYHGGDARLRWYNWWFHGYCNSFRFDSERMDRSSVGLGGNVGESLREIKKWAADAVEPASAVPAVYSSDGDDAGNGSIMRLAPIAIGYHGNISNAMEAAALQSRATHPGEEAAACCRFMAYIITSAITAHKEAASPPSGDPRGFISTCVERFQLLHDRHQGPAWERLRALLACKPPSPTEANWDWQLDELALYETLVARRSGRDGNYNGHPVDPSYFGSYCMDGLAIALWAVWHSCDFKSCLLLAVNVLGDADTTGAISGQLAGAIYGWHGIISDEWGRVCISNLRQWDPLGEIGLRAVLLFHLSSLLKPVEAQNHSTRELFCTDVDKILSILAESDVKCEGTVSCDQVKTILQSVCAAPDKPSLSPENLEAVVNTFLQEVGAVGADSVDIGNFLTWVCK